MPIRVIGGFGTSSTSNPALGGLGMAPKMAGFGGIPDPTLLHSLEVIGVPERNFLLRVLLRLGTLVAARRRS